MSQPDDHQVVDEVSLSKNDRCFPLPTPFVATCILQELVDDSNSNEESDIEDVARSYNWKGGFKVSWTYL